MNLAVVFLLIGIAFILGFLLGRNSVGKDKSQVISLTQPRALTFSEKQEIAELLRTGEKIAAIKQYRSITGLSLKEAKKAVDLLEEEINL